ncbi:hypothetical protein ABK040_000545 [Willaertia magna]
MLFECLTSYKFDFLYDFVGNNETITCCDIPIIHSHIFLNLFTKVCTRLRSLNILYMKSGRKVFSSLASNSIEEITIYSPHYFSKENSERLLLKVFEELNMSQLSRINIIAFHSFKTFDYNDDIIFLIIWSLI